MKKTFIFIWIISMGVMTSCDEYLDINSDPSNPQEAPAETLLPSIFQEMARGELFDSRYFGCYVQNWARISKDYFADLHGYYPGSDALGEKWRTHYWAIGKNIDLIIDDAKSRESWWFVGAALAIRAWSWQTSTDVYGEMILTEAWESDRYVFDYDEQSLIYDEVVSLCEEALTYLAMDDETGILANADLVYAGERDKWVKFIYAILARNAHHISNKSAYDPAAVIAYVDKALAANEDNFNVPHDGTSSANSNFLGPRRSNLGTYKQSAFAISLVDGTVFSGVVDPRLSLMFGASEDGVYRGLINGKGDTYEDDEAVPTFYSRYIYYNDAPYSVITAAEMQFIKAEAAYKKGDLTTALEAYTTGISLHMEYAEAETNDIEAYMNSNAVQKSPPDLKLSDIMLQKYIAMHGHGILETWVDMRRYHYSTSVYTGFTLPDPLYDANNGSPAYRARPRYNSEYVWNIEALEAIGATNTDYHTYEPWYITED